MKLFGKKRNSQEIILGAVADGKVIPMEKISDKVFSSGTMGFCCAIKTTDGRVYAPEDGKISMIADTLHAIGITANNGAEILIHVGIDTVEMDGSGFKCMVSEGSKVKKGQLLLIEDLNEIEKAGYCSDVITILTNSDQYSQVKLIQEGDIIKENDMIKIS